MRRLTLTITVLAAAAVPAVAQEDRRDRDRDWERERERSFVFSFGPGDLEVLDTRRGRLGITVDLSRDAARDSIGARVAGVTPGGPADRAGVRTGDIIVRLNGTRLAADAGREDPDFDGSRPGLRLVRLAARLDPGDTVLLDVRREGRSQTFTFLAEETDMDRIVERFRLPLREMLPHGPFNPRVRVFGWGGGGASDLELVRVTPQLAEGLGISEGLLVVDVGSDTTLGLRAGDVIVSIGGRRPTSPSHAARILSTYEEGEAVQFEVMRQRRRVTVNGRIPETRERWRIRHNDLELHSPLLKLRFLRSTQA